MAHKCPLMFTAAPWKSTALCTKVTMQNGDGVNASEDFDLVSIIQNYYCPQENTQVYTKCGLVKSWPTLTKNQ